MAFLLVHLKSFFLYLGNISPTEQIIPSFLIHHYRSYCMPYAWRPSCSESSLPSTVPVAKEFFLNFFATGFKNLRQFLQYLFTSNF